jgi:hypothetical protein
MEIVGAATPVKAPLASRLRSLPSFPVPTPTPSPVPPLVVAATQADTSGQGASGVTLELPNDVQSGNFLLAAVAIETAPNASCTVAGSPFECCTGLATGTCSTAAAGAISTPATWTLVDNQSCGTDLQMSIYSRFVQLTDTGSTAFTWNFTGSPTFLGVAGLTLFSNVNEIGSESSQCTLSTTSAAAPLTLGPHNLGVLIDGITQDNVLTPPLGFLDAYQHSVTQIGPSVALASGFGTNDLVWTAQFAGDNIGFQVGLSPLP